MTEVHVLTATAECQDESHRARRTVVLTEKTSDGEAAALNYAEGSGSRPTSAAGTAVGGKSPAGT